MLAPDTRTLLLDVRPPVGMRVDHAVATTFTLDLHSALMVPLALAGFNLSGMPDMVAVMEALRSSSITSMSSRKRAWRRHRRGPWMPRLLECSAHTSNT